MSPPSPADQRLQEISHLFLSASRARSTPPSPLQPASATSEPRRRLPPRVIAVGSATDPFLTTFIASRLAMEHRARGRRVLLFDGVGEPWFLRQLLAIEGEPDRAAGLPDPVLLRQRGLTWVSAEAWLGDPAAAEPETRERVLAAESGAEVIVVVLPGQSLAAYLECFALARQEFLVATETSQDGMARAFARVREIHARMPGARLGLVVTGSDRVAAEACFDRLASATARLLRASLRSYGYLSVTSRAVREVAAGRPLEKRDEASARTEVAAIVGLLLADGRPPSLGVSYGRFFDPGRVEGAVFTAGVSS